MALGVRLAACSVSLVCPRTRAGNEVRSSYGALASTTPRACLDGQNGSQSRVSFGLAPRGKGCGISSSAQGAALSKRVGLCQQRVAARAPSCKQGHFFAHVCVQLPVDLGQRGLTRQRHHACHAAAAVLDLQPALAALAALALRGLL